MKIDDQIRIWEAFNTLGDVLEGLQNLEIKVLSQQLPELKDIMKVRWQLNAIMNGWGEKAISKVIHQSTVQSLRTGEHNRFADSMVKTSGLKPGQVLERLEKIQESEDWRKFW